MAKFVIAMMPLAPVHIWDIVLLMAMTLSSSLDLVSMLH